MPRSRVESAGVSTSHMPVSLITAASAFSSARWRPGRARGWGADLLLALDHRGDGAGRAAGQRVPGAQRLDPHQRLALVVHRAAGDDALAVRAVHQRGLEGRAGPELQRVAGCTS
jgi:hypothetical protein